MNLAQGKYGDADVDTPFAHSVRVFDQLKGPKRLIVVRGAPHNGSLRAEVWREIEMFVRQAVLAHHLLVP